MLWSNVNLRGEPMGWRRRSTADFSDEIRAHIAHETDRLIADGMHPDEAARLARRRFGNVTTATERFYESRRRLWLDELRQDFHAARRHLVRYPVVAIVSVLSLGAGIGATAAALTIRDVFFENPPPLYQQPQQLSKIQVARHDRPIFPVGGYVPGDLYRMWRSGKGPEMAAVLESADRLTDVRTDERVEPMRVRAVTANFFGVLGVGPAMGRLWMPGGENRSGSPPAILSYRLWEEKFASRADIVGRMIWIDDRPHTVIGILPRPFWFSELSDPIWTLLEPGTLTADTPLQVVVRRPDVMSEDALAAFLQRSLADYSRQLPAIEGPLKLRVSAIKGTPFADQMSLLLPYVLGTAVLLTLLIACANVAILMIAQWTRRESETAMRSALGASRWRLVRAFVAESLLLASCAGAVGILATYAIRGLMLRNAPAAGTFFDLSIHPGVVVKSIAVTLAAGLLAGIGPALFETRRLQIDPLRGIAASDRVRQRWSHTLVAVEITVTLALLVLTTSMISGYQRSLTANPGFDLRPLMTARVASKGGIPVSQLADVIRQVPGVAAVSAATAIPLAGVGARAQASLDSTGANAIRTEQVSIASDFFTTLGVPMRAGRAFTNQDTPTSRTVIVSQSLAARLFEGVSPLGRQLWIGKAGYEIVGVVSDYVTSPVETRLISPKVYLPLSKEPAQVPFVRFAIRGDRDPSTLVQPVSKALQASLAGIQVNNTYTLSQMVTIQGQEYLVATAPLFPLIVIGMMLTSSGVYGVLAFAVSRRSRELAVRVALGAARGNQIQLVMAHSLRLVLIGSACGVGLTFGLSRLVRAAGGEGSLYDPPWPAFVIPVAIVIVVAALATWIPTRRALRVNPAQLLKAN
jgi:putative ABC transport system permease protein